VQARIAVLIGDFISFNLLLLVKKSYKKSRSVVPGFGLSTLILEISFHKIAFSAILCNVKKTLFAVIFPEKARISMCVYLNTN